MRVFCLEKWQVKVSRQSSKSQNFVGLNWGETESLHLSRCNSSASSTSVDHAAVQHQFTATNNTNHHHHLQSTASIVPAVQDQQQQHHQQHNNNTIPVANHSSSTSSFAATAGSGDRIGVTRTSAVLCCPSPRWPTLYSTTSTELVTTNQNFPFQLKKKKWFDLLISNWWQIHELFTWYV